MWSFGLRANPSVWRDALVPPHNEYDCFRFRREARSPCGQVGWRVYDCSRFYCGGFFGAESARASGLAQVRSVPFRLQGISRLTLEMTSVYVWFYSVNRYNNVIYA